MGCNIPRPWKRPPTPPISDQLKDPVKQNILLFRYVYHRSCSYIAGKMHYKESYIFALHLKALNSIYPLIDFTAD